MLIAVSRHINNFINTETNNNGLKHGPFLKIGTTVEKTKHELKPAGT